MTAIETRKPRATRVGLSDDELEQVLALAGGADSVELKLTVPDEHHLSTIIALWLYPDGSRILELSAKCAPAQMFQVVAESRAFLTGRGVDLFGEQQTKTATALSYFVAQPPESAP